MTDTAIGALHNRIQQATHLLHVVYTNGLNALRCKQNRIANDYMNDRYFKESKGTVAVNNIVVYRNASNGDVQHSAIVMIVGTGSGTPSRPPITVTSKLGGWGLDSHNIYNFPEKYGRNCTFYQVA